MNITEVKCPWCGQRNSIKFPCCGYLCMHCGKTFDEEDLNDSNGNAKNTP